MDVEHPDMVRRIVNPPQLVFVLGPDLDHEVKVVSLDGECFAEAFNIDRRGWFQFEKLKIWEVSQQIHDFSEAAVEIDDQRFPGGCISGDG